MIRDVLTELNENIKARLGFGVGPGPEDADRIAGRRSAKHQMHCSTYYPGPCGKQTRSVMISGG